MPLSFLDPPSELLSNFFKIIDTARIKETFDLFCDEKSKRITQGNYLPALQALGFSAQRIAQRIGQFADVDIDRDGGLDFDEFVRAVRQPSDLETWCTSLPLAKLLACCLESERRSDESLDPVRYKVSILSPADMDKVAGQFRGGLRRLLEERQRELQRCYEELDRKAAEASDGSNSKYTFEFNAGSLVHFHAALSDRVGELAALVLCRRVDLRSRRC